MIVYLFIELKNDKNEKKLKVITANKKNRKK